MKISPLSRPFGRSCGLPAACASIMLALPCFAQDGGDAKPVTPPATTAPAAAKVPEAKDIIALYVKALGGETAIRSHTSRMMKGEMELPAMGGDPMVASMVIYSAAPNKMLAEIEVPDFGQVRQGYDGKVAWSIDPMSGPVILPEEQIEQMKEQTDFYGEIDFDKRFKSMESLDERDFDGVRCYALKMIDLEDGESTYLFEVESGLLRGTKQTEETQMGPMEMTNINKEYKEFGGVKFPVHTEIEMMGMARIMRFSVIELDGVAAEVFALPDEVQALVKQAEEAAAEPQPAPDKPVEPAQPEPRKDKV